MKSPALHLDSLPAFSLERWHLKSFAVESILVVGVTAFWVITLPFLAAVLIALKVWDALFFQPSPLLLRRQLRASRAIIHARLGVPILEWRKLRVRFRCWGWP